MISFILWYSAYDYSDCVKNVFFLNNLVLKPTAVTMDTMIAPWFFKDEKKNHLFYTFTKHFSHFRFYIKLSSREHLRWTCD